MPFIRLRAEFECCRCGKPFSVGMSGEREIPVDWTVIDLAEEMVMNSVGYTGPMTAQGFGGISSVDDGRFLCGYCTSVNDATP